MDVLGNMLAWVVLEVELKVGEEGRLSSGVSLTGALDQMQLLLI